MKLGRAAAIRWIFFVTAGPFPVQIMSPGKVSASPGSQLDFDSAAPELTGISHQGALPSLSARWAQRARNSHAWDQRMWMMGWA